MSKVSVGQSQHKSETSETSATTALMKRLGIDVGDTAMAPKKGIHSMNGPKLDTNAFALLPKDRTIVYRYVVTIYAMMPKRGEPGAIRLELTKKSNGE